MICIVLTLNVLLTLISCYVRILLKPDDIVPFNWLLILRLFS